MLIRVGIVGSGTVNFKAWKLSADCDGSGWCNNFQLSRRGLAASIGATAHLGTKSISRSWGAGELLNLL